jgi:hypothetical protein
MEELGPKLVVGLIGQVIFWVALFIVLGMFKRIISFGISVGISELLTRTTDDMQRRFCKWFTNGEEILAVLEEMKQDRAAEK